MCFKKLFIVQFILLSFLKVFSQSSDVQESLLWEISGNGLKQSSYLFGTIHMIPKKEYFFTQVMQEKFKNCKTLALEVHLDSMKEKAKAMSSEMMFPDGKSLKDYMSESDYTRVERYSLDSLKVGKLFFTLATKMKPFFGSSVIMMQMIEKPVAYEEKLFESAQKNKMKITGLETFEYQLSVINSISIEKQVEMMYLDQFETNPMIEYNKMVTAYKKQNLTELIEASSQSTEEYKEFEDRFLLTRNKNWIPVIEGLVSKESTFIAVGAAHLPGVEGVLNLLKEKGYTVTPVK